MQTLENDEKEKREELETEYKDIEEKYRRELITLKVRATRQLEGLHARRRLTIEPPRRRPKWRTRTSRNCKRLWTGTAAF